MQEQLHLIVDAGGSSTSWYVINSQGIHTKEHSTGFSPVHQPVEDLKALIEQSSLAALNIDYVYFYGAGIGNTNNAKIVKEALQESFKTAKIEVYSDLLAAAHATAGNKPGVTCILGTGSNVSFYDGKQLISRHHSLGFILGDEGSGAYLGKQVLQHYFYNTFEDDLRTSFEKSFQHDIDEVLLNTYKKPNPNKYLAQFAMFLSYHRGHYMIENILEDSFLNFLNAQVLKYREAWTHSIHFIGSISNEFKDVLETLHQQFGLELGKVLKDPMEGLVDYYLEKIKALN